MFYISFSKRVVKPGIYALLNLTCWLIVMLGGFVHPSISHALSIGDEIVLISSELNVRRESHIADDNVKDTVERGAEGFIRKAPVKGPTYTWYYIDWKNGVSGWSVEAINGCKTIITTERARQKDELVTHLFNDLRENRNNIKNHPSKTDHDYNDYGCNRSTINEETGKQLYVGGHAGWDVRTLKAWDLKPGEKIADLLPINILFYSLTNGIVILDGRNGKEEDNTAGEIKYNTIAIYDEDAQRTTFYLHASDVHPSIEKGKTVKVGDPLGRQGDAGTPNAFHVHIEVQEGEVEAGDFMRASGGTEDAGTQTIDPIPYLYESIEPDIIEVLHTPIEITDMSPAGNDFGNFINVQRVRIDVDEIQKFFIQARSDDDIESISFVVSNYEHTRHTKNCHWFCESISHSVRYLFRAIGEYNVVATIESKTGKIVTREWLVSVQHNPAAPSICKTASHHTPCELSESV